MLRVLFLIIGMSIAAVACDENPNANKDKEGPVTNILDTVPPPADEAKGMDNRPGYNTTQMSTEVDKDVPIPTGDINIPPQGAVFASDSQGTDFLPNRYSFRYILAQEGKKGKDSPVLASRAPLFSASCLSEEDKLACSNARLFKFLKGLSYTSEDGQLVYAVAIIDEKGQIEKVKQTQYPTGEPCAGCEQRVRQAFEQMPAWEPAQYDGKAAKAQLVIPMRLKI